MQAFTQKKTISTQGGEYTLWQVDDFGWFFAPTVVFESEQAEVAREWSGGKMSIHQATELAIGQGDDVATCGHPAAFRTVDANEQPNDDCEHPTCEKLLGNCAAILRAASDIEASIYDKRNRISKQVGRLNAIMSDEEEFSCAAILDICDEIDKACNGLRQVVS